MFGSIRFMASEEFVQGELIDARTVSFVMGRTVSVFTSDGSLERASFRGSGRHYDLIVRACQQDRTGPFDTNQWQHSSRPGGQRRERTKDRLQQDLRAIRHHEGAYRDSGRRGSGCIRCRNEMLTAEQFRGRYNHSMFGVRTIDHLLQVYAWHGRHYVGQIVLFRERMR